MPYKEVVMADDKPQPTPIPLTEKRPEPIKEVKSIDPKAKKS